MKSKTEMRMDELALELTKIAGILRTSSHPQSIERLENIAKELIHWEEDPELDLLVIKQMLDDFKEKVEDLVAVKPIEPIPEAVVLVEVKAPEPEKPPVVECKEQPVVIPELNEDATLSNLPNTECPQCHKMFSLLGIGPHKKACFKKFSTTPVVKETKEKGTRTKHERRKRCPNCDSLFWGAGMAQHLKRCKPLSEEEKPSGVLSDLEARYKPVTNSQEPPPQKAEDSSPSSEESNSESVQSTAEVEMWCKEHGVGKKPDAPVTYPKAPKVEPGIIKHDRRVTESMPKRKCLACNTTIDDNVNHPYCEPCWSVIKKSKHHKKDAPVPSGAF